MANIFNEQAAPRAMSPAERKTVEATRACRVGRHFIEHYRRGAAERGHEAVARQLRKQGVPLEIAKLILLGRAE